MTLNKKMAIYSLAIFFVVLDRLLKSLALSINGSPIKILGSIFQFSFAKNYFIAFSLPISGVVLNVLIFAIIVALVYSYFLAFKSDPIISYLLMFIIFGAASNLFDRLNYGFVIDYFDLKYFTVFNVADIMIVIGACLLTISQMHVNIKCHD